MIGADDRHWFAGLVLAVSLATGGVLHAAEDTPKLNRVAWSSPGTHRVLVKVEPQKLGDRKSDESVAQVSLDFVELLNSIGVKGKADMREVVDAVMSAEQSLQAAVAIRDKIVAAYLEVSRMGI